MGPYKGLYSTCNQVESGKASVNICQIHLLTLAKKKPKKKYLNKTPKLIGLLVVASKSQKKNSDF